MVGKLVTRGSSRDRHGRGIRRPLWSPKFQPGVVRQSAFEAAVNDATGYLRDYYPDDFSELRTVITDWPPMKYNGLAHYSLHKPTMTIYVYRIPLQHLGRRKDPIDEMIRIERIVIEAASLLIDRDVRDFLGDD